MNYKEVDILISKNQELQILYLKHHIYIKNFIDKKLNKICENLIPTELTTIP